MAKTAKIKKRQITIHSRAARRASPSLELAPASKPSHSTRSPPPTTKPHVLAAQSSGITKKSKSKPMKRQQRERQLKGMLRAEDNIEKLAQKVHKSLDKDQKVRERRKGWEEVNGDGLSKKKKKNSGNAFDVLEGDDEHKVGERRQWGDEEMGDGDVESGLAIDSNVQGEVKDPVELQSVPLPELLDDEIL